MLGKRARPVREGVVGSGPAPLAPRPTAYLVAQLGFSVARPGQRRDGAHPGGLDLEGEEGTPLRQPPAVLGKIIPQESAFLRQYEIYSSAGASSLVRRVTPAPPSGGAVHPAGRSRRCRGGCAPDLRSRHVRGMRWTVGDVDVGARRSLYAADGGGVSGSSRAALSASRASRSRREARYIAAPRVMRDRRSAAASRGRRPGAVRESRYASRPS